MARSYVWALYERSQVTLDSNGSGTIRMAPGGARERWKISVVSVTCTQTVVNSSNVPTMLMYRGSPVPANQIGGTYTATLDTDSTDQFVFNMNEDVYFVFSGGDAGAIATIRIEGTRYVWE